MTDADSTETASRPIHAKCTPEAAAKMAAYRSELLERIQGAIAENDVVVVGMATNPFIRKVRDALDGANVKYEYIGIGGYLSKWKDRLAVKLWTGWPTFPQVFVKGTFIGGNDETREALADGSFKKLLGIAPKKKKKASASDRERPTADPA